MFRDGLKVYPLSESQNPPAMEFIDASGREFNTIHANNFEFYEELATVLEKHGSPPGSAGETPMLF